jgi:hypothetical protein
VPSARSVLNVPRSRFTTSAGACDRPGQSLRLPALFSAAYGGAYGFWEGERRRIFLLTGAQPRGSALVRGRLVSLTLLAACGNSKRPGLGVTPGYQKQPESR